MIEVERKRILKNRELLTEKLLALGFVATDASTEVDIYYSRPDVDYIETIECLRIRRRNEDFAEITYKPATASHPEATEGITAKKESNVLLAEASQAGIAEELFKSIGMVELARVVKERQNFSSHEYPSVTVSIDNIEGVGQFVEAEVMSENIDDASQMLSHIEKSIQIDTLPIVTAPYRDIVIDHQGRKNPA